MKQRGRKPKCPYCRSARTIRKGVRQTVTLGDRPLCFCRDCSRKFTLERKTPGRFLSRLLSPWTAPSASTDLSNGGLSPQMTEGQPKLPALQPTNEPTRADSDFSTRG